MVLTENFYNNTAKNGIIKGNLLNFFDKKKVFHFKTAKLDIVDPKLQRTSIPESNILENLILTKVHANKEHRFLFTHVLCLSASFQGDKSIFLTSFGH